jgi:hypothetical protein
MRSRDINSPPLFGDNLSLLQPRFVRDITPVQSTDQFLLPGSLALQALGHSSTNLVPDDILSGDNPNPVTPLKASEDPLGLMETPEKKPPYAIDAVPELANVNLKHVPDIPSPQGKEVFENA